MTNKILDGKKGKMVTSRLSGNSDLEQTIATDHFTSDQAKQLQVNDGFIDLHTSIEIPSVNTDTAVKQEKFTGTDCAKQGEADHTESRNSSLDDSNSRVIMLLEEMKSKIGLTKSCETANHKSKLKKNLEETIVFKKEKPDHLLKSKFSKDVASLVSKIKTPNENMGSVAAEYVESSTGKTRLANIKSEETSMENDKNLLLPSQGMINEKGDATNSPNWDNKCLNYLNVSASESILQSPKNISPVRNKKVVKNPIDSNTPFCDQTSFKPKNLNFLNKTATNRLFDENKDTRVNDPVVSNKHTVKDEKKKSRDLKFQDPNDVTKPVDSKNIQSHSQVKILSNVSLYSTWKSVVSKLCEEDISNCNKNSNTEFTQTSALRVTESSHLDQSITTEEHAASEGMSKDFKLSSGNCSKVVSRRTSERQKRIRQQKSTKKKSEENSVDNNEVNSTPEAVCKEDLSFEKTHQQFPKELNEKEVSNKLIVSDSENNLKCDSDVDLLESELSEKASPIKKQKAQKQLVSSNTSTYCKILSRLRKVNAANKTISSHLYNEIEDSSLLVQQKKRRIAHTQNEDTKDEDWLPGKKIQSIKNKRRKSTTKSQQESCKDVGDSVISQTAHSYHQRLPRSTLGNSQDPSNETSVPCDLVSPILAASNAPPGSTLNNTQNLSKGTISPCDLITPLLASSKSFSSCKNSLGLPSQNVLPNEHISSVQAVNTPLAGFTITDVSAGNDFVPVRPRQKQRKFTERKCKFLMHKLLNYSAEEKALNEVCEEFSTQQPTFVAQVILDKVSVDVVDKPDNKYHPAPLMTETQRILLGLMSRFEKISNDNIMDEYLTLAEKRLLFHPVLEQIEPITSLYLAICKYRKDINRIRKLCFDAFYFMNDYALPLFFTVLRSWSEVLPFADECERYLTAKVFVQIVYLKESTRPGYNLLPLRDMLVKFYGYPVQRWDCGEIFKEIFTEYLKNPVRPSDSLMLLYCKNLKPKMVHKLIEENIKPLVFQTNIENFQATVIILVGNIVSQFKLDEDEELVEDIEDWLEYLRTQITSDVVHRSINLSLSRLPQFNATDTS